MNCPVCDQTRLREVEKNGIMIDVCPSCKGVWLDRGELDKLMSGVREARQEYDDGYEGFSSPSPPQSAQSTYSPRPDQYPPQQGYGHNSNHGGHGSHGYSKHKKKKHVFDVFGDLFD